MSLFTMSREVGSGGNELARRLCKRLSYRYFERIMMNEIAAELGFSDKELVEIGDSVSNSNIFIKYVDPNYKVAKLGTWLDVEDGYWAQIKKKIGEVRSVELQTDVIKAAAKKGNIVIVGRGSQVILKDFPGVIHIRVIAPAEKRAENAAKEHGFEISEARKKIIKYDKASSEYVRKHYHIDSSDPLHYHIILNTGMISLDDAENLLAGMA